MIYYEWEIDALKIICIKTSRFNKTYFSTKLDINRNRGCQHLLYKWFCKFNFESISLVKDCSS